MEDEKQNESLIIKGVINQLKADNDSKLRDEMAIKLVEYDFLVTPERAEREWQSVCDATKQAYRRKADEILAIVDKHTTFHDTGIKAELEKIVKHRNGDYTYHFRMVEDEN